MNEQVFEFIKYGAWLLCGSGVVFEITPFIKLNPISAILNILGKKINKDLKEEMSLIKKDVKSVSVDLQEHVVESQRRNILDFADELMRGEQKTQENFKNIILLHDKYEKYIETNNIENGQVELAFSYISTKYKDCLEKNSFYTGK